MLRAIALKLFGLEEHLRIAAGRDHNATSYSTETNGFYREKVLVRRRDHNATSYSTET